MPFSRSYALKKMEGGKKKEKWNGREKGSIREIARRKKEGGGGKKRREEKELQQKEEKLRENKQEEEKEFE